MTLISAAEPAIPKAEDRLCHDSALMVRASAGDAGAFEQLMMLHESMVMRLAWRILGRREDARDAAQEVFFRLYRNLHRIREESDLRPWLYTVTANVCRDIARKRGRLPLSPLEPDQLESQARTDPDVIAGLDLERQRQLVQSALKMLATKERTALVLRDIEGLSSEEVAQVLGSSAATVRSQVASARIKIRRFCEHALRRSR